jgi:hypothetical protein
MTHIKRIGLMLALVGAFGMSSSGCFVSTSAEPAVATNYYTPLYYNGYVVYYDNFGRPIYYVNGAMYYVPSTYMYYGRYVSYYNTHRAYYHRWYRARGMRYRSYRRGHRAGRRSGRAGRRGGGGHRRHR